MLSSPVKTVGDEQKKPFRIFPAARKKNILNRLFRPRLTFERMLPFSSIRPGEDRMRNLNIKTALLSAILLTAPIAAKERTGALAPPEVKKEQDAVMALLTSGNKKHAAHHVRKTGLPRVMIVSCADSRVPPETVFKLSPGEIYTNRAFGNIVDRVLLGSLEYGAENLNCRVLVVMGHTGCTALKHAIEEHDKPRPIWRSLNAQDLNERLQPAVAAVVDHDLKGDARLDAVVRVNVINTMRTIREQSPTLWNLERADVVKIVGAIYHLDTGKVEWIKQ
jgi:carbonic anhydrase